MALSFSSTLTNNPMLRGNLAAPKQRFGEFDRYAVAPIHTRFDAIEWLVWDAEIIDEATGLAAIIRQADTMDEALLRPLRIRRFRRISARRWGPNPHRLEYPA